MHPLRAQPWLSRDGRDGSLTIHQDINLSSTVLDEGIEIDYTFDDRRRGFLQIVRGSVEIDGEQLSAGDAVATQEQPALSVKAVEEAELLLFDMA